MRKGAKNNYPTFRNDAGIGSGLGFEKPLPPSQQPLLLAQNSPMETYGAMEPGTDAQDLQPFDPMMESPWDFNSPGLDESGRPYDIQVDRNVPLENGGHGISIKQVYR